jgi:hypothetical protein
MLAIHHPDFLAEVHLRAIAKIEHREGNEHREPPDRPAAAIPDLPARR